jgi:serpin B
MQKTILSCALLALLGCGNVPQGGLIGGEEQGNSNSASALSEEMIKEDQARLAKLPKIEDWFIKGQRDFAWEMSLEAQKELGAENFGLSPSSISFCLGMVGNMAGEDLLKEYVKVLRWTEGKDKANEQYGLSLQWLGAKSHNEMLVANRVFTNKELPPPPAAFQESLRKYFGGEIQAIDMKSDPKKLVDDWIASKTKDLIKDGCPALSPTTPMVLVNALYFKGKWALPFNKESTRPDTFRTVQGQEQVVAFMNQAEELGYWEDKVAKGVLLPYRGWDFLCYAFMPQDPKMDLGRLMGHLRQQENLFSQAWSSNKTVHVSLPKFELKTSFVGRGDKPENPFYRMGLVKSFGSAADFSLGGLSQGIEVVKHDCVIQFDEEGTVAAASTVAEMKGRGVVAEKPREFNANRPFLVVLYHRSSQSMVLVAGINKIK